MLHRLRTVALLLSLLSLLALSACGGDDDDGGGDAGAQAGGGPVELTFLTHWAPETVKQLEAVAADYTAQNPDVTVKVRAVPFAYLLTTMRSQAGSDDGPTISSPAFI